MERIQQINNGEEEYKMFESDEVIIEEE